MALAPEPPPAAAAAALGRVDPEVALPWVISLRWVAVIGQAVTICASGWLLGLTLPLAPLGAVMAVTVATNVALRLWLGSERSARPKLLGAVLTLDTLLLTALLGLSGGPQNPFAILYVIHVALAAVALSAAWGWWMVLLSSLCFALLHPLHVPLHFHEGVMGPGLSTAGQGIALLIVAANVAYFSAGVSHALRRREEELRQAEAQLARNEWLASLAALAAGTAHELGTPLGTIAVVSKELELAATRLSCQTCCGQDVLGDAQLIRAQVERCRRILDRLGALDREGLGNAPEPLGLEQLLAHLREDQRADFAVEVDPGIDPEAMVHPDAAHALQPLLKNALDAVGDEAGRVRLRVGHTSEGWRFAVQDDGPGMRPDVLACARQPFFTTKEHGRGMGLGLYLVGLIVERHGGRLELTSREGEGVTATLDFPDSPQRRSGAAAAPGLGRQGLSAASA
ncbi:MAG: ATP-binding protein [Planctomycetota bacterium]